MKKILISILLLLVTLTCVGCKKSCNDSSSNNPAVYVLETESYIELNIFDEERTIYVNSTNPNESVRFVCSSDVLTVEADGRIIPNKTGEATVQIICGDLEKTCVVKVLETNVVPVISIYGIDDGEMNLIKGDVFPLSYSVSMSGKNVEGSFQFSSTDESTVSVSNDGVLTAKKEGVAEITVECTYKIYTVNYTLNVNVCKDLVVKLSENRLMLTIGDSEQVNFIGVYEDENVVVGASVTWVSTDNNVATVDNGLITAVNYGKAYVKAIYNSEGKEYVGFVLVNVREKQLEAPANFSYDEINGKLVWDVVEGASGYCIYDGTDKISVTTNFVNLDEFGMSDVYFGEQKFTIYAYSDDKQIRDSEKSTCLGYFSSINYTDRMLKKDTYDAEITVSDNKDFEADATIYYAECTSTSLPGKSDVYGYLFKKVYFTNTCFNVYGNGVAGAWCNTSLMNPAPEQSFYDSKITFWAYAEQKTEIVYLKMDQQWARTIIAKQTLEPYEWTKITFAVSSSDFPYLTMLSATDNFYFIDFRISGLTYQTKDYSGVDKSAERLATVINAINDLPNVTESVACGNALKNARDLYDDLTDRRKVQVTNYQTLTQKETEFGNIVYDSVKSNTSYISVENKIKEYNDIYDGATINKLDTFEKKAADIVSQIEALDARCYYGLIVKSETYKNYVKLRADYSIVEDARGAVGRRIVASSYFQTNGSGFVEIHGVDTVSEAVKLKLNHHTYGYCMTMGTNPRVDTAIRFKNKDKLSLEGYTHIVFAVRNPREEKMGVYLYDDDGRVKTLAENIGQTDSNGVYTIIEMTVEEFMNYDISFGYDMRPAEGANVWLTRFIAIKKNDTSKDEAVIAVEELINNIGEVTADNDCINKISAARKAYNELPKLWKNKVSNYDILTRAENMLSELPIDDQTQEVIDDITDFLLKFTSATIENYLEISAEIAKIDGKINELSEVQKARISDYEKYKAIKSSYTLVYNMVGSDLKDKISVTGDGSSFDNVETHQYPDAFKPLSDQGIYGYCARVKTGGGTGVFKFQPTDAFKAMLDLSAYTHVLIGVRSETRTCTYKWSDGTNPRTLATSTNTTDFITLRLTVDEFLNGYIYVESGQSTFWFASIIAVYDPTTVITEIDAYLDALGDNNVTLENYKTYINAVTSIDAKLAANKDCNVLISNLSEYNAKRFKVVDNMLGSDLTTARFTVTGDRARDFLGPDSHSNPTAFAPVVHEGAYGKCARLRVKGGTEAIIKIKYNLTPDLSDYDYVYVGIYSEVGTATWYWKGADGQTNVATVAAEVGQCKVMKISVEDFLNGYLFTNGGANNDAYWLTPIIAIAE